MQEARKHLARIVGESNEGKAGGAPDSMQEQPKPNSAEREAKRMKAVKHRQATLEHSRDELRTGTPGPSAMLLVCEV